MCKGRVGNVTRAWREIMATINIDNIEEGMVLAEDVVDRFGNILLAAGNSVSEKTLRIFKMWGVTEASITGIAQEEVVAKEAAGVDPEMLRQAEEHMGELFHHCNKEDAVVKEIFRLSALRTARKLEESNGHPLQSA